MKLMSKKGFTLIELLVVITIMAIVGTFAVVNYKSFGQDKDLESAALDIQSQVRTAQTNATAGVKCDNDPTHRLHSWRNNFYKQSGKYKIVLNCQYLNVSGVRAGIDFKLYELKDNLIIEKINNGTDFTFPNDFSTAADFSGNYYASATFIAISGQVGFIAGDGAGVDGSGNPAWKGLAGFGGSPIFTIYMKNTTTNSTKQVIIDKGGRVYVQ